MRFIITILIFSFYFNLLLAQNLVPNPSFEEYIDCPEEIHLGKQLNIKAWRQPTRGSIDYFNTCSDECGVPENLFGHQDAKSGNAYAGIHVLYYKDYREYLQAKLKEPLKAGIKYRVRFYLSLSEHSKYAISQIGVLFTKEPIYSVSKTCLWVDTFLNPRDSKVYYIERFYKPQFVFPKHLMLDKVNEWMLVSGIIMAKGGEEYITIGNFKNDLKSTQKVVKDALNGVSYYYIDNVTVITYMPSKSQKKKYLTFDEAIVPEPGQSIILKNVLFEFDKTVMLPGSYKELDKLANVLKANPKLEIEIRGHTDIRGTDAYNIKLSDNRAKTVTLYLVSKGISNDRISYKGYGRSKPIASNKTDEGRQLNRRVEFRILKN